MLAAGLPGVVDLRLPGEPGRADSRVGEIDVARLGAEERARQNADRSFTDRILRTNATRDTGQPVNAWPSYKL